MEEQAKEALADVLKDPSEEASVAEAMQPSPRRHGESKEVFHVAHTGKELELGILR